MIVTRFIIAAFPRTGSNWLCGTLDSHPEVVCHYEALHPAGTFLSHRATHAPTLAERNADPRGFVERLYGEHHGCRAVGFKAMWGQEPELVEELLADPSVAKIVLRRENRLRVYVSARRATITGAFAERRYDHLRVAVDPDDVLRFADDYACYFDWIDVVTRGQDVLRLTYERLFEPGAVARALRFLGVEPDELLVTPAHARQSSDSLRHAIANFDELAAGLAGTDLLPELLAA